MTSVLSRRGHTSRRLTAVVCVASMVVQMGCYSYLPIQETVPANGQMVSVTLNDRGRQLVGDKLGEFVEIVDGTIVLSSETAVTLSVTQTKSLRGIVAIWAGEQVELQKEGIRGFRQRQLSKGRTALLTVGIIAGIAAIAGLISLAVSGSGPGDNGGGTCVPPACFQR